MTKPFLKWAGGKYRLFDTLNAVFPKDGLRFVEPFVGAGSVALNVHYDEVHINDFNSDLTNLWQTLKDHGPSFVSDCESLFTPENNTRERYIELRQKFNDTTDVYEKSTLFVYMNRHCFNGLCRYNLSNKFNVPFGKYDLPFFPKENLLEVSEKLKKFTISNLDFREVFSMVREGDIVYCDPPYVPLSTTSNFDSYSSGGFGLKDHLDLAALAAKASETGATVVISNAYNWYTKNMYQDMFGAHLQKVEVSRTISATATERNKVEEVIATFRK